jgi:hypothetical protein
MVSELGAVTSFLAGELEHAGALRFWRLFKLCSLWPLLFMSRNTLAMFPGYLFEKHWRAAEKAGVLVVTLLVVEASPQLLFFLQN